MRVEVIREEPKPVTPPIKEVVLHLTAKEAHDLKVLASLPDPFSLTRNLLVGHVSTYNIGGLANSLVLALKDHL